MGLLSLSEICFWNVIEINWVLFNDLTVGNHVVVTAVARLDLCHLEAFSYANAITVLGIVGFTVLIGKNASSDFGIYCLHKWIVYNILKREEYGSSVAFRNLSELERSQQHMRNVFLVQNVGLRL